MIHYHGMSEGGSARDTIGLATGRHCFISFERPQRLEIIADVVQSFALDNGAYSAWRQGKKHDFAGFVEFAAKWIKHPACDFVVIPDEIDGTEKDNDRLEANFLHEFPERYAAPVWHLHESLPRLERLAERFHTVCLGSSGKFATPNTTSWWARIDEAMRTICDGDGRPSVKLHGLRMLDPRIFSRLPLHSADSTNAERNGILLKRFGMYVPPTRGQRSQVIAHCVEATQSAPAWTGCFQRTLDFELA